MQAPGPAALTALRPGRCNGCRRGGGDLHPRGVSGMQLARAVLVPRLAVVVGLVVTLVILAAPVPSASPAPARDPSTEGAWSGVINTPNTPIHMALMPNGKIFSWKGYTGLPNVVGYTWDLASNTFTPTPQVGY